MAIDLTKANNKKQVLDELGMSSYAALRRIVERAGVTWMRGQQLFTPAELKRIFVHYDHQPAQPA